MIPDLDPDRLLQRAFPALRPERRRIPAPARYRKVRGSYFLTSNSFVATAAPSAETSTLYFPTGQPEAFATWNSRTAGPAGMMSRVSSLTSWPFAPNVQRTLIVALAATPSEVIAA